MNKQIEEMAKICCNPCEMGNGFDGECAIGNDYKTCRISVETATALYNADYRKQKQGEWIETKTGLICTVCNTHEAKKTNYCPNCGAKMKGVNKE